MLKIKSGIAATFTTSEGDYDYVRDEAVYGLDESDIPKYRRLCALSDAMVNGSMKGLTGFTQEEIDLYKSVIGYAEHSDYRNVEMMRFYLVECTFKPYGK
jgi:hypothetical protein